MQVAVIAACTVLALTLVAVLIFSPDTRTGPSPVKAAATLEPGPDKPSPTAAERPSAAAPEHLRIPRIGVDADIDPMGLEVDGELEVPSGAESVGWWSGGEAPSQDGPTVLVGHRDSREGAAVFFAAPNLRQGDKIVVEDASGKEFTFVVQRVELHRKDEFPTQAVYAPTVEPTLRLLTCGGTYDPDRGYRDNYVVFASLPA